MREKKIGFLIHGTEAVDLKYPEIFKLNLLPYEIKSSKSLTKPWSYLKLYQLHSQDFYYKIRNYLSWSEFNVFVLIANIIVCKLAYKCKCWITCKIIISHPGDCHWKFLGLLGALAALAWWPHGFYSIFPNLSTHCV